MARDRNQDEPQWVHESAPTRQCTNCEDRRPVERAGDSESYPCPKCGAISVVFCQQCSGVTVGMATIACQDGVRRCHVCYDGKYVAPFVSTPMNHCPDCEKLVSDHVRYVNDFLEQWQKINKGKRWSLVPGLLERMGHQPARQFDTRPAAEWSNVERVRRAQEATEAYQRHLGGRS